MKKQYRVKKSTEIEAIIKNKKYCSNRYFTVYQKENSETIHFRYAISVGKKIGNAVCRNKLKRQIRMIIQNFVIIEENSHKDLFIIARNGVNELPFIEIQENLIYLLKKSKLKIRGEN